jgi:membrane-bound lytic murein transglycosylase D
MTRFRVLTILISALAVVSPALGQETKLPTQGLEQRVDFWKKVFTQYGKDDHIIHDGFYVNLIYGTAKRSEVQETMATVRETLREIREKLDTSQTRSPFAQQIAESIVAQGLPLSTASLNTLIGNLHSQQGVKERFRDGIVRSGRYVEEFRQIVKNAGVPEELALLPLVESSFENVRSKAGAMGMWQFTRGTGKQYLKISSKVDERLDPIKSARAAAQMLRENYNALGEWPIAITAYNHGRPGMMRAKRELGADLVNIINDYKGPVFGYASMNFYAEFLAAVEVYKNYPQFYGDLVLDQPLRTKPAPALPVQLASAKTVPAAPKAAKPASTADKYKVKPGDSLWVVAQRFGTSIRSLMELNNLKESAIYAGQILLVK